MKLFKVYYNAKWDDKYKKHSHDHMRLEFLIVANSNDAAISFCRGANPDLDLGRFETYDDEFPCEIKEGLVILWENNSFDE